MKSSNRELLQVHQGLPVKDGAGVSIRRNIATLPLGTFDPFIMLDEFASDDPDDYIAGFPEHPHRGFETVTYMLAGKMEHRDHLGNRGLLASGSVQWMTAGRGILHSEMPLQEQGRMHGFQLWINLPASEKWVDPSYQEFTKAEIPVVSVGNQSVIKVIAGELNATSSMTSIKRQGPVGSGSTAVDYFDIHLSAKEQVRISIPNYKRVLLYVYSGALSVLGDHGERQLASGYLGHLGDGDSVAIKALGGAEVLLLAAVPINEPIAQWGPFVMNTREEIEQALQDYRSGRLVC